MAPVESELTMKRQFPEGVVPAPTCGASDFVRLTLARLYDQLHSRAIFLTQSRQDADDLVQRVAERALSHPDALAPHKNAWAWLLRVMRNLFIDDCRMKRVRKTVPSELSSFCSCSGSCEPAIDAELSPCDLLTTEDIMKALGHLPAKQRSILELAHLPGRSYRELSAQLGVGCNTVGTRLLRARRQLKGILEATYLAKLRAVGHGARTVTSWKEGSPDDHRPQ